MMSSRGWEGNNNHDTGQWKLKENMPIIVVITVPADVLAPMPGHLGGLVQYLQCISNGENAVLH